MLLHLVPYLINFCFSDAEEKQNKEGMIETNTQAQLCARAHTHTQSLTHSVVQTITNSWENREGGRGNMSRDLVTLCELFTIQEMQREGCRRCTYSQFCFFFQKQEAKRWERWSRRETVGEESGRMGVSFPRGSIMELFFSLVPHQ